MVLKELTKIKRLLLKVICLLILMGTLFNSFTSYSYGTDEHDRILNRVLFGNEFPSLAGNKTNKLKAIDNASYLCVDQYNNSGKSELSFLRNTIGVKGIIKSISEINFSANYSHRKFTHQGWNYKYTHTLIPNTDIFEDVNWDRRKKILLETCKKIFDFSFSPIGYDKRCDAFSSMVYYVHLIGDYQDMSESDYDKYKMNADKHPYMIPLYKRNDSVNILNGLEDSFKTLFSSQKSDDNYRNLLSPSLSEISKIKSRLSLECSYEEFTKICEDLIDVLQKNVPDLLKKEEFFRKEFYK